MSSVNEFYSEKLCSPQRWVSRIHFACPNCEHSNNHEVEVPFPDVSAEKMSDMIVDDQIWITCAKCNSEFEGEVWVGPAHCNIELSDHPECTVSCDPPGFDRPPEDWYDDWESPENPTETFKTNHSELSQMIKEKAEKSGRSVMNRMIFTQIITFLEAFLCDTLVNELSKDSDLMIAFCEKDGAIKDISISVSQALKDPENLKNLVAGNLKGRLYHKFGSRKKPAGVCEWYRNAFNIGIAKSEDDLEELRRMVALRHDCIHRNGKTKDDEVHECFTPEFLACALTLVNSIVDHIDIKLKANKRAKITTYEPLPF